MSDDDLRARLERSLDLSEQGLDRLDELTPQLVRDLLERHTTARTLPSSSRDRARDLYETSLSESIEFGRRMLAVERRLLDLQGEPDELRALADRLEVEVRSPAVDLAEEVRADALRGTVDGVTGEAAESGAATTEAYRDAARDQDRAVDAAAVSAALLVESLSALADSLDEFSAQVGTSVGAVQRAVMRFVTGVLGVASGSTAMTESDRFVERLSEVTRTLDEQLRRFESTQRAEAERVRDATAEAPDDWDEGRR